MKYITDEFEIFVGEHDSPVELIRAGRAFADTDTGRYPFSYPNDDFVQAGTLYRNVMSDVDRNHVINNIVHHLGNMQKRIQLRQTALFYKTDPDYGRRVAEGFKLSIKEIVALAEMPQEERAQTTR